jgi:hypothetical protein
MAEHRLPKQITYLQRSKAGIHVHNPYVRFGPLADPCTATRHMSAFRPEADEILHAEAAVHQSANGQKQRPAMQRENRRTSLKGSILYRGCTKQLAGLLADFLFSATVHHQADLHRRSDFRSIYSQLITLAQMVVHARMTICRRCRAHSY